MSGCLSVWIEILINVIWVSIIQMLLQRRGTQCVMMVLLRLFLGEWVSLCMLLTIQSHITLGWLVLILWYYMSTFTVQSTQTLGRVPLWMITRMLLICLLMLKLREGIWLLIAKELVILWNFVLITWELLSILIRVEV